MRIRILKNPGRWTRPSAWARALSFRLMVAMLVAAALWGRAGSARADDFVVIRNAKNTTTALSAADAKSMAIGKKKTWPGGAVVLMVLPAVDSPALGWFASTICGVSGSSLMAKIKQEVFKGELRKPVIAASPKEVIDAVAADDGAMGIVAAGDAKALPASVATLTVNK